MKRLFTALLILLTVPAFAQKAPRFRALVFARTAGFYHDSIPDGIAALWRLGREHDFTTDVTQDPTAFTEANLRRYQVLVFLNTTGDVLDGSQQKALQTYIHRGGGYVGVHAATDTEHDWDWYKRLVGAEFATHPRQQDAVIRVEDRTHPATKMLPAEWKRFDEWYAFKTDPRPNVHVLATLDEKTYEGGTMGADHPIIWCHEFEGGRAFYTALGHTKESYTEPLFLQSLLGGLEWAAGLAPLPPAMLSTK